MARASELRIKTRQNMAPEAKTVKKTEKKPSRILEGLPSDAKKRMVDIARPIVASGVINEMVTQMRDHVPNRGASNQLVFVRRGSWANLSILTTICAAATDPICLL